MSAESVLTEAIEKLGSLKLDGQKILSAYLDTSPQRLEGQDYLLAFRDACKTLRPSLPADDRDSFEAAVRRVEAYLVREFAPHHQGLAIFAADRIGESVVVPLPEPAGDFVTWETQAEIGPLEQTLDDHERFAVLAIDREHARLFSISMDEIEEQIAFEDEVPRKQSTGDWFALAQTRYARHTEDHVRRHLERALGKLMEMLRRRPFDRLFLAGPEEIIATVRHTLPRPLRARLSDVLALESFASDAAVLDATLQAAEKVERQDELAQVDELLNSATSAHAEMGPETTMSALRDGRVHVLILDSALKQTGYECQACGSFSLTPSASCAVCGSGAIQERGLKELAIGRARAQAARVEMVTGAAAHRLAECGGIGAWTRY